MEKVYLVQQSVNHFGDEDNTITVFKTFEGALREYHLLIEFTVRDWEKQGLRYEVNKDVNKEIPVAYWSICEYGHEFENYKEIHIKEYAVHKEV